MLPLRWFPMKGPVYPLPVLSFWLVHSLTLFYNFPFGQITRQRRFTTCLERLLGEVGFGEVGGALHFG